MNPLLESQFLQTRRQMLGRAGTGIGTIALASLLNPRLFAADEADTAASDFFPARSRLGSAERQRETSC